MSREAVTRPEYLVGPERTVYAPCPHCKEPVAVHGVMFPDDDREVIDVCHWCETEFVASRRTVFVEYALTIRACYTGSPWK